MYLQRPPENSKSEKTLDIAGKNMDEQNLGQILGFLFLSLSCREEEEEEEDT